MVTVAASAVLTSPVRQNGTITVAYPSGYEVFDFKSTGHKMVVPTLQAVFSETADDFDISFGASNITVTYKEPTVIPTGTTVKFDLVLYDVSVGVDGEENIVDVSDDVVTATGSTTARTLADRMGDSINVKDFGAYGDGTTDFDSLAAFNAAIASIPSGETALIVVPKSDGDYYLSAATTLGGRVPVFYFAPGADIIDGPNTKLSWPTRWIHSPDSVSQSERIAGTPDADFGDTIDCYRRITNTGTTGANAQRLDYRSSAHQGSFDIADTVIGVFNRTLNNDGGADLTRWTVAISPTVGDANTRWAVFCEEKNVVNRHADHGWSPTRTTMNNYVFIEQLIPEANDFGEGGTTYNILAHQVIGHSATNKADGIPAQSWNGSLMEADAICGDGYGAYWSGNSTVTAARDPMAVMAIAETWQYGYKLNDANLTTGIAYALQTGDRVAWLDADDTERASIYGLPSYVSGKYYSTWANVTGAAAVPAVDVVYFYPFQVFAPVTMKSLHARVVTAGAGSAVKVGIWANSTVSNLPLGAPIVADNTGQATTSSNSNTTSNIADTLFPPGWYWAGTKFTGTLPTMVSIPTASNFMAATMGVSSIAALAVCGVSIADAYANDMPTLSEGAAFTVVAVAGAPVISFLV
jgi:hypothetical protein